MHVLRPIQNRKLTCFQAPLRRRRIFLIVVGISQPGAASLGPAPRPFLWAIQVSRLDLSVVILSPEEDVAALARKRCPKTRRPHLLAAKVHCDVVEEPEYTSTISIPTKYALRIRRTPSRLPTVWWMSRSIPKPRFLARSLHASHDLSLGAEL